mgnify:CR=1 FL=1
MTALKSITIFLASIILGGISLSAQTPLEESISTKAFVRKKDAKVIDRGVVSMRPRTYTDSLSKEIVIERVNSGQDTISYNYYNAIFGKDTLSFKERKPLFTFERRGQQMLEFRSEAFPHHRYEFCIDGMTEREWSDLVESYSLTGKDERLMNNEQTCIFYALNLLFDAEGICPGPIITDDTSFTDGRQLNAFFDHFLDEYMTISCKWSDVKKVNFPKSCVLAFMNDKEEIIHAVYCREGSEYNPKGYAFFSKNGLFTPIVVDSLKPILDTYSKYGSGSAEKIVVYTAQSF